MKRRGFLAAVAAMPSVAVASPDKKVTRVTGKPIEARFSGIQRYLLFKTEEDRQSWAAMHDVIFAEAMFVNYISGKIYGHTPTGEIFYMCRFELLGKEYDRPQHFITHVEGNVITDHLRATKMSNVKWESL